MLSTRRASFSTHKKRSNGALTTSSSASPVLHNSGFRFAYNIDRRYTCQLFHRCSSSLAFRRSLLTYMYIVLSIIRSETQFRTTIAGKGLKIWTRRELRIRSMPRLLGQRSLLKPRRLWQRLRSCSPMSIPSTQRGF